MVTRLTWSDEVGKRVRTGGWQEQARPTIEVIREALDAAGGEFWGWCRAARDRRPARRLLQGRGAKVVYLIR